MPEDPHRSADTQAFGQGAEDFPHAPGGGFEAVQDRAVADAELPGTARQGRCRLAGLAFETRSADVFMATTLAPRLRAAQVPVWPPQPTRAWTRSAVMPTYRQSELGQAYPAVAIHFLRPRELFTCEYGLGAIEAGEWIGWQARHPGQSSGAWALSGRGVGLALGWARAEAVDGRGHLTHK